MDLVCLILWIIDLFKPSIELSISVLVTAVIGLFLLTKYNRAFSCAYIVEIAGIVIALVKIFNM